MEGGRQTYIKGVESTSYLRLSESRKSYPRMEGDVKAKDSNNSMIIILTFHKPCEISI